MSAATSATPELRPWRPPAAVRYADLALLALALPLFLVADFPLLGWAGAAAAWLLWRGIGAWTTRKAEASRDPRTVVGLMAASMIGRGWLIALTIFGVGLADHMAGLAAAVLAVALFTLHFSVSTISRSLSRP